VHRDYAVAARDAEAGAECELVAEVAREADAADPWIAARLVRDRRPRRVRRAVVDEDDFPVLTRLLEDRHDARDERADVLRFVVGRGDDGEHHARVATARMPSARFGRHMKSGRASSWYPLKRSRAAGAPLST